VRELLSKLVLRETRPAWADWARQQLAAFPNRPTSSAE
jgi:hypothetical protein